MGTKIQSTVTEYIEISAFSGAPAECRHHLLYGRGIRDLAERDGLWIPLTNAEHNLSHDGLLYQIHGNPIAEKLSKMCGQLAFEKEYYRHFFNRRSDMAREEFRKRYGISYL